jgi:hypothetical protein
MRHLSTRGAFVSKPAQESVNTNRLMKTQLLHTVTQSLGKLRRCKIAAIVGVIVASCISSSYADPFAVNFMLDEKGDVARMSFVSLGGKSALNKTVPLEENNRGLLLTNFKTGHTIAKFEPKKRFTFSLMTGAYSLDSNRIVMGFLGDLGIWNIKTNKFTLYRAKGSLESEYGIQISGVHPDEDRIISCYPFSPGRQGLFYHDLQKNTITQLFKDYQVTSPRFSPDGSRYAFYGTLNRQTKDEKNYLIVQALHSKNQYNYEFHKDQHGVNLSWSPSGSYLAGIGSTGYAKYSLYIWNNTGRLTACIPLTFNPPGGWPPLWLQDEKGIWVFYKKNFSSRDENISKHKFTLQSVELFGVTRWVWLDVK